MDRPDWAPEEIDIERPSAARMYDFYLGGNHNFAADRAAVEQIRAVIPDVEVGARANRAFLRRAVRFLAESGIRQFLDIGSGIPTLGNVHEIAQQADPTARVAYVDIDPVAVAHSRKILAGNGNATAIQADGRQPERVLADPEVRALLDFDRPIAVMLVAMLHFVSDDENPAGILRTFHDAVPSGSYLVLSHGSPDSRPQEGAAGQAVYNRTANPLTLRTRAELTALFDGFALVPPGVVWVPEWRPDSPDEVGEHPERTGVLGGVGRKE
ncbi:SAM-dependent methyltransferase [Luedemannella helvata]|uniref:SAM-dependent methyltransferase n=1 Tax=Luedemannella helvata TaxID=349315 RepID=A0ABP4WY80_9ACTN